MSQQLSDRSMIQMQSGQAQSGQAQSGQAQSNSLLAQTRQLFQHQGSNAELMAQIMSAIRALHQLSEPPQV